MIEPVTILMNSWKLWLHAQGLQKIEPVNTPSGWGGAHKTLLLTDGYLGKKIKFSSEI